MLKKRDKNSTRSVLRQNTPDTSCI